MNAVPYMSMTFLRHSFVGLLVCLTLVVCCAPAHATDIHEVTSPGGIRAWLVQDSKLPLVSMQFAFRGGVEQDPVTKQGLANLTTNLLTEGAGPYDAEAFQKELADHSIALHFVAGRDQLEGNLKTLSVDKDKAFALLYEALAHPQFNKKDMERLRRQQLTALRMQLGSPDWQARYALFQTIFGNHPYGQRRLGTIKTLAGLTQADVKAFARDHMARDNLMVAVAGDVTPKELGKILDQVFGDLPKHANLVPVAEVVLPQEPSVILVPREGTQTELLFAMPGPKRSDPDWYAAEIANYILGGGGFSARLMQEVRDKNGLTYGISTSLSSSEHGGLIVGEAATDNPKTGRAWTIAMDTLHGFYDDGVTEKEITAAKDYLTGSLPLAMTSTDRIAKVLLDMQVEHLGLDYLDRHNDLIRSVTADDIDRVIRRWFNPDGMTLSMVGKPEGVSPTRMREAVRD